MLKMSYKLFLSLQIPKALIDVLLMQVVSLSSGSSPWVAKHVEGGMIYSHFSYRNDEFTESSTHPKKFMPVLEWTEAVKFTALL